MTSQACTVLISSSELNSNFGGELRKLSDRVIGWPTPEISRPKDHAALDQAIDNLFGYDWLVFASAHAVKYFLDRYKELDHDLSELDALSVCGIGPTTFGKLAESQIHVDVFPNGFSDETVIAAISDYVGGTQNLQSLNFLIPRAVASADSLPLALESTDARADVIAAYQLVSRDQPGIEQLKALLVGGGIDYVALAKPRDVEELAEVFDTNDLSHLLSDVSIAVLDRETKSAAAARNLVRLISPAQASSIMLARAISEHEQSASRPR